MSKRKIFYSLIQVDGVMGIRAQDGYEMRIDGEKFNAYQSIIDDKVYILDPQNGLALQTYDVSEDEDGLPEIELIENAKEKFIQSGTISKWKEKRNNESYRLTVKIFKALKRVKFLREKQKEAVCREIKERRQQDNE